MVISSLSHYFCLSLCRWLPLVARSSRCSSSSLRRSIQAARHSSSPSTDPSTWLAQLNITTCCWQGSTHYTLSLLFCPHLSSVLTSLLLFCPHLSSPLCCPLSLLGSWPGYPNKHTFLTMFLFRYGNVVKYYSCVTDMLPLLLAILSPPADIEDERSEEGVR